MTTAWTGFSPVMLNIVFHNVQETLQVHKWNMTMWHRHIIKRKIQERNRTVFKMMTFIWKDLSFKITKCNCLLGSRWASIDVYSRQALVFTHCAVQLRGRDMSAAVKTRRDLQRKALVSAAASSMQLPDYSLCNLVMISLRGLLKVDH